MGERVVDSSVGIRGASAARPRGQAPWPAPALGLSGAAEALRCPIYSGQGAPSRIGDDLKGRIGVQ